MKQENICFNELCEAVLNQLRNQNYMDSTLTTYKRFYNRLYAFIPKEFSNREYLWNEVEKIEKKTHNWQEIYSLNYQEN